MIFYLFNNLKLVYNTEKNICRKEMRRRKKKIKMDIEGDILKKSIT